MEIKSESLRKNLNVLVRTICKNYALATIFKMQKMHVGYSEIKFSPSGVKRTKTSEKGWESFQNFHAD